MTSTETVRLETRPRPPRKLRMAHLFVVIFVIAALVAIRVSWRHTKSAVMFYIAFVLVDAVLSLGIYGVNFLGVF